MRMDHVLATGPFKDGEVAILGCDKRGATLRFIALIVDKLRGGKMPGASELVGMNQNGLPAFDGFGYDHLFHLSVAFAANDLRAEAQDVVSIIENHSAIYSRETGDRVHGAVQPAGVFARSTSQFRQSSVRR
jgi:hypothetical protein